jgi:hypothetical protein
MMFAGGAAKLIVMRGLAASAKASARQHGKAAAKPWRSRDPRIHLLRKKCFFRRWIAGSSPAMTACPSGDFA